MSKKITALAFAGLASGAVFAQSNVTVYGLLDAGYNEVHTDGARTERSIDSSQTAGSRLGFKGSEDLGNGLKALFVLEYALANDINSTIGSASKWSATATRQSYVGLGSDYGTLTLGRLQTAAFTWACSYSPLTGGIFRSPCASSRAASRPCCVCRSARSFPFRPTAAGHRPAWPSSCWRVGAHACGR